MRVFVTGGAGYVGSHCCKAFAEAGWEVVVFDNLSRGWRDFVRWGPLIEGDILDPEALRSAMRNARPDAIAHFAASAYVAESIENPRSYYRNNLVGALNVLDAMLDADVSTIIFSSTCATYGIPERTPIDERHPQHPINPYGRSKLMVEKALADYAAAYGVHHVVLRYFNAAGADGTGQLGERHEPETHVIPLALRGALDRDYVFTIHGDDYDTRDGTAVRDYIHVTDLALGHTLALEYVARNRNSEVFNLGTGSGVSVAEVANAVERIAGVGLTRRVGPRRTGDPPALVANASRAHEALGWWPRHSDISNIVETAWRWHAYDLSRHRN